MPIPQPAFIAFEGGEGSGKSTQLAAVAQALTAAGHADVVLTREPGGSPRAEQIRNLILDDRSHDLDPRCEALLFAAARADHVTHTVKPALERGAVVLTDRYLDSSVAYQGGARALGEQRVRDLSLWATDGLEPDLTVVLDIDPRQGLARALDPNRLEAEPLEFHDQVRAAFLRFAHADPDKYVVVAADRPAGDVTQDVLAAIGRIVTLGSAS